MKRINRFIATIVTGLIILAGSFAGLGVGVIISLAILHYK